MQPNPLTPQSAPAIPPAAPVAAPTACYGHRVNGATPTESLSGGWMLTREEAALRCGGFSRSWITRFLKDEADRIPSQVRPDTQLVVNRVPVDFVRWFLTTGRLLPRRAKPAKPAIHSRAA